MIVFYKIPPFRKAVLYTPLPLDISAQQPERGRKENRMIGQCCECKCENVEIDEYGYCPVCNRRLDWQLETGRCGWCHRPVLECTCDDSEIA